MNFIRRLFSKKDYTHKHVEMIMGFLTLSLQQIPKDYLEEKQVRMNTLFYILGASTSYCKHMKLPNHELEVLLKALSPLLKENYDISFEFFCKIPDFIPFSVEYDFIHDIVKTGVDDFDKAMTGNPYIGTAAMNNLAIFVSKWYQEGETTEFNQYVMDIINRYPSIFNSE